MSDKVKKVLLDLVKPLKSNQTTQSIKTTNKSANNLSKIKIENHHRSASLSFSPTKLAKMSSLLSQIEENAEIDEKSGRNSNDSDESSVSPYSKENNCIKLYSTLKNNLNNPELVFNYENLKSSPTRSCRNEHPLNFRYIPEENNFKNQFAYESFDDYFKSNFYRTKENKYEFRITEFDIAEKYLSSLGKAVANY